VTDEPSSKKYGPNQPSPLRRIFRLAIPEWKSLAVGTVFLVIGGAMGLSYPQAIRVIIDGAMKPGGKELIDLAAVVMGGIFLIQAVAVALRYYIFTVAGERVVARLRETLYRQVIAQEIGFFDERRTGELLNRLSSDTTVLQNTVSVNVSMALRSLASVVGGVALLLYTSPALTGIMLLIVPPVVIAAVFYGRKIRTLSRKVQDALADASEVAEETLSGIRTVRSFAQESGETKRYGAAVWRGFEIAKDRSKVMALFQSAAFFAGYAAVAVVLWYGGRLVADELMTVGDLTQFILYTLIVAFSFGALGGLYGDFMRAAGAAERVFSLMDREPTIAPKGGRILDDLSGLVRFKGVNFHYPSRPDVQVLKGVDLEIRPGEIVALVGPSGGGKSTIASLIGRFYDPDTGTIEVDDVDLREVDVDWLHRQIGAVAQEPILFSTTVADNILYGREGATREDVEEAARAANAHDFVTGFPEGYETLVGERGVQLSGGQKQRVAIARAVLKNPRILILDEATSALDAESEHLVKEALDRLMRERTTLVIAHRLSTVKDADRVVVIDGGAITQVGTHDELMAQQHGMYRKLVERQLAA
jgi:ABC transporter fused permease/ATP-binding protein